jgi:hypothetical protein
MVKAAPGIDWLITIQARQSGEPIGAPRELAYADSYVTASEGGNTGHLVGRALWERRNELLRGAAIIEEEIEEPDEVVGEDDYPDVEAGADAVRAGAAPASTLNANGAVL